MGGLQKKQRRGKYEFKGEMDRTIIEKMLNKTKYKNTMPEVPQAERVENESNYS